MAGEFELLGLGQRVELRGLDVAPQPLEPVALEVDGANSRKTSQSSA